MSTTLYFSRQPPPVSLAAFSPSVAANWTRAVTLTRYRLATSKLDTSGQGSGKGLGATVASSSAFWQFVSDPLAADVSLAGKIRLVMMGNQSVNETANLTLNVRVVKPDGTQRGLLLHQYLPPTGASPSPDPVPVGATAKSRLIEGLVTTVAAVAGDRIVAEIGFTATGVPSNTGSLTAFWGATPTDADLTFVRDVGFAGAYLNPWMQFEDVTLAFAVDAPNPNTRLYLTRNATAAAQGITVPAMAAGWARARAGTIPTLLTLRKPEAALLPGLVVLNPLGSTATSGTLWQQFISAPFDRDQLVSGTATLVVPAFEQTVTENSYLAFTLRVVTPLGAIRGTLVTQLAQAGTEFATSIVERKQAVAMTNVSALKGDRLLLEVGVWAVTPSNNSQVGLVFGASGFYADAIGDETAGGVQVEGGSFLPWLEITKPLTFATGTFLGLYDATGPSYGGEWPLNVVAGSFQELPTVWKGGFRRNIVNGQSSQQRLPKRGWSCTAEFATGESFDAFLVFIDAAANPNVQTGNRLGSKVLQLYSDPWGAMRSQAMPSVRVEVGAVTGYEAPDPSFYGAVNTGWAAQLTFHQV